MGNINFADLDSGYQATPPQLVGMYPLGGGGLIEAPYRHYFELRHLIKIIKFSNKMNILELGCGNGRWAVSLAPRVAHYTGIDVTPRALEIARTAMDSHSIRNADFQEMSILDFKGGRPYDLIYFSSVSQYLEDSQIHQIMNNLSEWIKPTTIIVDRSTLNYPSRYVLERPGYYSILRTPQELDNLFRIHGFSLVYYKRSYRFLRGARFLKLLPLNRFLPSIIQRTQPVSLYTMLFFSWLADTIKPKPNPFNDCGSSHDFLLFEQ